jgi:hypothetical protein
MLQPIDACLQLGNSGLQALQVLGVASGLVRAFVELRP